MKFSEKQLKVFALIFFILLYAIFYLYKITKYDLFYYNHDLFSVLSSGNGWIFGHPLWWDNRYGFTPAVHFTFIAPLLSPFTILFGGKGFFMIHILVYFLAFYFTLQHAADKKILNRLLAVLIVFFISPYAFWLFDDTYFGWHIELLFLPFSVFFALALISKKRWLSLICAVLLISTKEDGCVIACCIQLFFSLSENTDQPFKWKQFLKIGLSWLGIFFVCLFAIKYFNDFKPSRIEMTLNEFYNDQRFFNAAYFRKILWHFIVMLFPLLIISFFLLNNKNFLKLIFFSIPVMVTGIISGLWYSGNAYFSIAWVPRFVEIMGLMLAGIFIFLNHQTEIELFKQKIKTPLILIFVLVFQFTALTTIREYDLFAEIKQATNHELPKNINPDDERIMKCISKKTPHNFNVAVPYEYFSLFDKNDLTWFDHPDNALQKNPDLVILGDSSKFSENKFDYDQYRIEKQGTFYVLLRKDKMPINYDCN